MRVSDAIALLFVTSAVWWFLTSHSVLTAITVLVAGLLCLIWLLSGNVTAARAAHGGLLALAAAALLACMAWAMLDLARHT